MRRLTYGNIVATLALFLALSGGAVWAANKITSKQIGKGAVKNKNLAKNAVKAKNLAKGSVTSAKLGEGRGQERATSPTGRSTSPNWPRAPTLSRAPPAGHSRPTRKAR